MSGLTTIPQIATAFKRAGLRVHSVEQAQWLNDQTRGSERGHIVVVEYGRDGGYVRLTVRGTATGLQFVADALAGAKHG